MGKRRCTYHGCEELYERSKERAGEHHSPLTICLDAVDRAGKTLAISVSKPEAPPCFVRSGITFYPTNRTKRNWSGWASPGHRLLPLTGNPTRWFPSTRSPLWKSLPGTPAAGWAPWQSQGLWTVLSSTSAGTIPASGWPGTVRLCPAFAGGPPWSRRPECGSIPPGPPRRSWTFGRSHVMQNKADRPHSLSALFLVGGMHSNGGYTRTFTTHLRAGAGTPTAMPGAWASPGHTAMKRPFSSVT